MNMKTLSLSAFAAFLLAASVAGTAEARVVVGVGVGVGPYYGYGYPAYYPAYPAPYPAYTYYPPAAYYPAAPAPVVAVPAPAPASQQTADSQYCREYTHTITVDGQKQPMHGTACRQPDGSWKIVQ